MQAWEEWNACMQQLISLLYLFFECMAPSALFLTPIHEPLMHDVACVCVTVVWVHITYMIQMHECGIKNICQRLNAEYTHVLLVRPCCRIQVSLQDCHDFPQRDRELASGISAPRKDTFGDTRSICAYNIIVCPRLSMFIFRRTHVGQQCRLWRHCHYLPNYRRLLYFMLALYYKSLLRTDGCLLDICDYL